MKTSREGHDWYENQISITMDPRYGPVIGWLHAPSGRQMTVGCADCPWHVPVDDPESAINALQQHRDERKGH